MTAFTPPFPQRFDLPEWAMSFVPLTPALVDDDYAAVMRDVQLLRDWSGQDWPTSDFTREENLTDLVRHDREQHDAVALTYSVLVHGTVQGCIYARPLHDALRTRDIDVTSSHGTSPTDVVVRGWAHDIDAATLITASRLFLVRHGLAGTRLWWQTNTACPAQLDACDATHLTDSLVFEAGDITWVLRAAAVVRVDIVVPE